jgi:hypothetical protein
MTSAGRFSPVPFSPPYALATPRFRFRALAALAGRSSLGGDREVVLAMLLAGRLVIGALPPRPLPQGVRATRASGARAWLAALALPAAFRQSLARLIDATASVDPAALEPTWRAVVEMSSPHLDAHAIAELREVLRLTPAPA